MYSVIIEQFDLTKACIKEFTPNIVLTDILSLHNKMDDAVENEQKTQTHARTRTSQICPPVMFVPYAV
jgi:hypothetical protein